MFVRNSDSITFSHCARSEEINFAEEVNRNEPMGFCCLKSVSSCDGVRKAFPTKQLDAQSSKVKISLCHNSDIKTFVQKIKCLNCSWRC